MFRKIYIIAFVLVLASCKGTKYTSQTKKPTSKPKTERTVTSKPKPTPKPKSSSENLEATSNVTVYSDVVKNYINQYKEIAKDNMRNHGIPASITLAQGILESGAGNGRLAKEANNHFGIKCHTNWTGETIRHDDDAAQECFRKYRHASESFQDHSLFLTSRSRYNDLFKLKKDDYEEEVLGKKREKKEPKVEEIVEVASSNYTHQVQQGDTLYNISKRYNTTVDELKRLNNLSSNDISIGQVLRVK